MVISPDVWKAPPLIISLEVWKSDVQVPPPSVTTSDTTPDEGEGVLGGVPLLRK